MQRRERTRHLIKLDGLVQKAGLADLANDDLATVYGSLLELGGKPETMILTTRWHSGSVVAGERLMRKRKHGRRRRDRRRMPV